MSVTGHIFIYGEIGRGTGQVSINTVRAQLDPQASDYILHIASPGGDVFEGFGIYNILKNNGKKIETHIEAVTASIATLVAFAGERIIMNKTAQFMIHNPYITDLKGDSRDLETAKNQLDKIKNLLMEVSAGRAARNGKPINQSELSSLYDNETWFTSEEALSRGFVDEVQDAIKAVAKIDLNNFKMEKQESWLKGILKNLTSLVKFKNEFTETLQDGTKVVVMSEDGDWAGKQVITESGEALPPGDYTLASGKVISVGENSTIAEVKDAPAAAENKEDMSKIKELEEKLAAALQGQQTAEAKLAEASKVQTEATAKFENRLKDLESKMKKDATKEEEEKKKVVGQTPVLNRGPVNAVDGEKPYDAMGEDALKFFRSRNLAN